MNRIQIILSDLLVLAEYMAYFVFVFRRGPLNVRHMKRLFPIGVCLFLYICCIVAYPNKSYTFMLAEILSVFLVYFFMEEKFFDTLKIWVIGWWFLALLESFIDIIVFGNKIERSARVIENSLIIILIFLLYYCLIGRKVKKIQWNNRIWGMFVSVVAVVELMISYFSAIIIYIDGDLPDKSVELGSLIVTFGGIAIYILLFSLIYYFNQKEELSLQNEVGEKLNEQQREYFVKLLDKEKNTRAFRHDIFNHLLALKAMGDKGEYDKLIVYLNEMLEELDNLSGNRFDVGNEIVNTIINYYLVPVKEVCNIRVIGYMIDSITVSQKDICVVVSNIVKNAIEAVDKTDKKDIIFEVGAGKDYFRIYVENTFSGDLTMDRKGNIVSTKNDITNHGIGLKNVTQIVKKYNGKVKTSINGNIFSVEVFLPI